MVPQLKPQFIDVGSVAAVYVNLAWVEQLAALAGGCICRQDPHGFWTFQSRPYGAQRRWQTITDLEALAWDVMALDSNRVKKYVTEAEVPSTVERDLARTEASE